MRDALAACASHLQSFGGHAMAGGLRIDRRRVGDFTAAFTDYAAAHVKAAQLQPTLRLDAEATLPALSYAVVEHLVRLAPFGQGNPPPLLAIRGCKVLSSPRRMGRGGGVLSLMLSQNGGSMRAVGFSMGELAERLVGVTHLDVAAEPMISTFNGQSTAELQLKDVSWEY
jgi:single-stranded-DNA-specific exonuclease